MFRSISQSFCSDLNRKPPRIRDPHEQRLLWTETAPNINLPEHRPPGQRCSLDWHLVAPSKRAVLLLLECIIFMFLLWRNFIHHLITLNIEYSEYTNHEGSEAEKDSLCFPVFILLYLFTIKLPIHLRYEYNCRKWKTFELI